MERTVPSSASEEVELYTRTYYSLLRSTSDVQIKSIEEVHSGMNSLLHSGARESKPDMSAFIYTLLRLPDCIRDTKVVVLGQGFDVFHRTGVGDCCSCSGWACPALWKQRDIVIGTRSFTSFRMTERGMANGCRKIQLGPDLRTNDAGVWESAEKRVIGVRW